MIHMAGGCLIFGMGAGLLCRKDVSVQKQDDGNPEGFYMFLSSFAVGITNPAAILTFLFAFSWFGISGGMGLWNGLLLVCGVFIGTYLWWAVLTMGTAWAGKRAAKINLCKMNRIFGIILCLFGGAVFLRIML